jgi:hypothetical protein
MSTHPTIIKLDKLQDYIELVLDANPNVYMTKSYLYSRVLDRVKPDNVDNYVHPVFRKNFELIYKYYLPQIKDIQFDSNTIIKSFDKSADKNNSDKCSHILNAENDLDDFKEEELLDYILSNGTELELTSISQLNGNTFYHDCMKYPNIVRKLILLDKMNYHIKNKDNLTPLECINDVKVTNILISQLHQKTSKQSEQINLLEKKQKMMINMILIYCYIIFFSFLIRFLF